MGDAQPSESQQHPSMDLSPVISDFVKHHPDLVSEEISTFPEFNHHIKLAPDAVPITVKTLPVPYAIQENVADAVRLLDSQ